MTILVSYFSPEACYKVFRIVQNLKTEGYMANGYGDKGNWGINPAPILRLLGLIMLIFGCLVLCISIWKIHPLHPEVALFLEIFFGFFSILGLMLANIPRDDV